MLPTISQIHSTVIPVLAGQGTVFMDAQAHKTIYDGCSIARGSNCEWRIPPCRVSSAWTA